MQLTALCRGQSCNRANHQVEDNVTMQRKIRLNFALNKETPSRSTDGEENGHGVGFDFRLSRHANEGLTIPFVVVES